ncbi:MAG: asparaginase [Acidobacteria bacterium]|nr:asparaginase [Acidobacteriota bacterium]
MNTVIFFFTGGTISMKHDAVRGGAVPALSGEEILAHDPELKRLGDVEVVNFSRLAGPQVTPKHMWDLSEQIRVQLERPEVCGAVVTHGTDTLEETAFFLDLRHGSPKPVIVIGAMRNASELSYDGPANVRAAMRVAMDESSRGQGVFVMLNETIHAAAYATKMDTQAIETFQSPVFGPLGIVDQDRVFFARVLKFRQTIETTRVEERVDLFQMYAGADGRFIDAAREQGARGIVIEGTGRGNVPPMTLDAIQRAIDAGLPVLIATRCAQGRVLDTYAYEGSGRDLRNRGVIFAGNLTGPKARILLMLALGITRDPKALRQLIEAGQYF